jgi:hypothetical protein
MRTTIMTARLEFFIIQLLILGARNRRKDTGSAEVDEKNTPIRTQAGRDLPFHT